MKKQFDKLADSYGQSMVKYLGPGHMARIFQNHINADSQQNRFDILDLGCGTGLCGRRFKAFAKTLIGMDLSPKMLDEARKLAIYDQLYADNVENYLNNTIPGTYDLVTSAGVFVYMGDLHLAFKGSFTALRAGGHFLFTVDRHDEISVDVKPATGSNLRFTFSQDYLEQNLRSAGFRLLCIEKIDDRLNWQNQDPVPAFVILAQRPDTVPVQRECLN